MIKYEAPKINITYFEDIVKTGGNGQVMHMNGSFVCRTAAQNLNAAAADPTIINSVATRTVRVQTILQFNDGS